MKNPFKALFGGPKEIELVGTPVVVYQMGKVASSSIAASLERAGIESVYQVHYFQLDRLEELIAERGLRKHSETALALRGPLFDAGTYARYISVVREPIARNISAFFQNYELFAKADVDRPLPLEQARAAFLENYPHDIPLTWFDTELRVTLGVDVFEHDFPQDEGFQQLQLEAVHGELLVLQLEMQPAVMRSAIAQFIGQESIELIDANVGSEKAYSDAYREFRSKVCLPESYVDRMLDSKYARHFYSDDMRAAIRKIWLP